ncbi:hypothetical protein [Chromatium okenii]|uniref:hypothetical protein n=1 Tax=Chromatium okenii TaxID=61644 RepID=UPI0026EA4D2A|nr:hypothetical protein [Chromatium okenii]MBV5310027.1 hypothetical protein [Chromatium okenii]
MSEIAKTTQCSINAVSQKLKQGLDKKLQSGGQQDAIKLLEEAYQCARPPSQLPPPWPQITAYRLAHLLMRSGCKTDWHKIDRLLEEASSGDGILGAMPLIYRLVSLQQCHAPYKQLQDACKAAISKLKDQSPILDTPKRDEGYLIQSNAVNLLEMAVYFTGLEYKPLEGQIELGNDFFADLGVGKSAWFVLDSRDTESIAYPESIARQIFMQRRETGDCLAIEYNGGRYARAYLPNGECKEQGFSGAEIDEWQQRLQGRSRPLIQTTNARKRKSRFLNELKDLNLIPDIEEEKIEFWWQRRFECKALPSGLPVIVLTIKK